MPETTVNSSAQSTYFSFRWLSGFPGWLYRGTAYAATGVRVFFEMIGSKLSRWYRRGRADNVLVSQVADEAIENRRIIEREAFDSIQAFLAAQHDNLHPDASSTSPYVSLSLDKTSLDFLLADESQAASFILHLASFPGIHYIDLSDVDFSTFEQRDYDTLQNFLMDLLDSNPSITRINFSNTINYTEFLNFNLIAQKISHHRAFYVANYRQHESSLEKEEIKRFYLTEAPKVIQTRKAKIDELYTRLDRPVAASSEVYAFPIQQISDIFNRFREKITAFLTNEGRESTAIAKTAESFTLCPSVKALQTKIGQVDSFMQKTWTDASRKPSPASVISTAAEDAETDTAPSSALVLAFKT
jgi:hypothetical protein